MLILYILVVGMMAGWLAHLALGHRTTRDYRNDLLVGIVGSFVGGLLFSLLAGDGLDLQLSGLIGSTLGAILVLAILDAVGYRRRSASPQKRSASGQKRRR